MIVFLLSLTLMLAAGILATKFITRNTSAPLCLVLSLGAGAGIAIASSLYFVLLNVLVDHAQTGWWICEVIMLLAFAALLRYMPSKKSAEGVKTAANQGTDKTNNWLDKFFIFTFLTSAVSFWAQFWLHPHSNWDALMIWNVRARFLERAPSDMSTTFNQMLYWSHPDYPLLIPAVVSLGLSLSGENQLAPLSIAFIFTTVTGLLLLTSLSYLKSRKNALLAAILLFTTPFWTTCGAMMLADVPIAFYFLSTLVCLSLYDREPKPGYMVLAGAFAGAAAWTKNEGQLFILCLVLASIITHRSLKIRKSSLIAFVAGILPIILLLLWFKLTLAPQNDLVAAQGAESTMSRLLNPTRYIIVAQFFVVYIVTFGNWLVSPVPLLLLSWFMVKARFDNLSGRRAFLTMLFVLLGYEAIFLVTPSDLPQHLSTSIDRLILQLWPSTIFAFALCFTFTDEPIAEKSGDQPEPAR